MHGSPSNRTEMDSIDRELLNLIQTDFPLVARPYAALGERLGIPEAEAIERTARLKEDRVIREISAIFDSARLGYRSVLVALEVPDCRLLEVGRAVAAQQGVSHCYARDHRYNLWFTLTVPPEEDPAATARRLQGEAAVERMLVLPALRRFKIGVSFDLETGAGGSPLVSNGWSSSTSSPVASGGDGQHRHDTDPPEGQQGHLTDLDRRLVLELQKDLPTEPRPFSEAARRLDMEESALLEEARRLLRQGTMRRFAAVLRHRVAGFLGNGMSCWIVPPDRVEEVGRAMAGWPAVTHCYERPTYPDWPYNLFGMLHARTKEKCLAEAAALAAHLQLVDYVVLFSHHEFKKERVRYFQAA